jgi:sec-independent protein translocase protein TatA
MGSFSLSHWLVVLVIALILFGAGRLPKAMGDLARGIRNFRSGMRKDGSTTEATENTLVKAQPADPGGR